MYKSRVFKVGKHLKKSHFILTLHNGGVVIGGNQANIQQLRIH